VDYFRFAKDRGPSDFPVIKIHMASLKVGDDEMLTKVRITQKNIDEGIIEFCHDCPLALALRRVTGEKHCAVHPEMYFIAEFDAPLPPEAIEFVRAFDAGEPVKPITLELDLFGLEKKSGADGN